MTNPNYRYPRNRRLLKPEEFDRVFKAGHRKHLGCLTFFYETNTLDHPRLGFAVSKRSVKQAVKRNRIKRLVRESVRVHQHQLKSIDIVVTANRKSAKCEKEGLKQAIEEFITMMGK